MNLNTPFYHKYFPFYDKAPKIAEKMISFNMSSLFAIPFLSFDGSSYSPEIQAKFQKNIFSKTPVVYRLAPLDVWILDPESYGDDFASVVVTMGGVRKVCEMTLDYYQVASILKLDYPVDGMVEYPEIRAPLYATVPDLTAVMAASQRVAISSEAYTKFLEEAYHRERVENEVLPTTLHNVDTVLNASPIRDSSDPDIFAMEVAAPTDISANAASMEDLERYLSGKVDSMMAGDYRAVPCLMGDSGVAKSAIIKSLAQKHNLRMMDFRVAFITNLDIQGLVKFVATKDEHGNQDVESYQAIMSSILECSDQYIEFCEESIKIIANEILTPDITPERKAELERARLNFLEKTKTPVLFLDEVNRCGVNVRRALVQILSERRVESLTLNRCRVVAAANIVTSHDESMKDIFQTKDSDDAAYNSRFIPIIIRPEDVRARWIEWASVDNRIHPVVLKFLERDPAYYYDNSIYGVIGSADDDMQKSPEFLSKVIGADIEGEIKVGGSSVDADSLAALTPFPNYRTWEMTSKYLKSVDQNPAKEFFNQTLVGLLGKACGDAFSEYLTGIGYTMRVSEGKNNFDDRVMEAFITQTPLLMVSASSIGKTSRVNKLAKDTGSELITINLSQKAAMDINGAPYPQDLVDYSAKGIADRAVKAKIATMLKTDPRFATFPASTTIRSYDSGVAAQFKRAMESGRKVVLFFDEINRVQTESVMTSVFEAISDNRIFGQTFDPAQVSVMAACNLGEKYEEARSLDRALASRFQVFYRPYYTSTDLESFIQFMEEEKFEPSLVQFFKELDPTKALEFMAGVEDRTFSKNCASTRALRDLNSTFKNSAKESLVRGSILFPTDDTLNTEISKIEKGSTAKNPSPEVVACLKAVVAQIAPRIDRWAARYTESGDVWRLSGGKTMTSVQVFQQLKNRVDSLDAKSDPAAISKACSLALMFYSRDVSARYARKNFLDQMVGPEFAAEFAPFYNTNSGMEIENIELEDCVTEESIKIFADQVLAKAHRFGKNENVEHGVTSVGNAIIQTILEYSDKMRSRNSPALNYFFVKTLTQKVLSSEERNQIINGAYFSPYNGNTSTNPYRQMAEEMEVAGWYMQYIDDKLVSVSREKAQEKHDAFMKARSSSGPVKLNRDFRRRK